QACGFPGKSSHCSVRWRRPSPYSCSPAVGKTSLLQRVFADYNYVSLDLPSVAEEAEEAGERFLEKYPPPVIIDEVQYAPKLFRYIKARVDRQRDRGGQFLVTGSQKLSLMAHLTESLAGRVTVLDLHSLSLREIEDHAGESTTRDTLLQRLFCGGYPEVYSRGITPPRFFADYVATYLERDVRQVLQVRNLRDFDRFLRLAAVRTGQMLSLSSFASDLGLSPNTVKT
ncbi:MAG: ATP-binding protein, partial [Candidatus Binatia bacterium]